MGLTNLGIAVAAMLLMILSSAILAFVFARKAKRLKKNMSSSTTKTVSEKRVKAKAKEVKLEAKNAPVQAVSSKQVAQAVPAPVQTTVQKKPYSMKIEYTKNGQSLYTKTQSSSTVNQFITSLEEGVNRAAQDIASYDSAKFVIRQNDKIITRKFCKTKDVMVEMMRFVSDTKTSVLEEEDGKEKI